MTDTRVFGLDVSNYDGLINWGAVEAHIPEIAFMGFRSTISWGYRDPFFKANWASGKGKVLRTAYHVVYPGEDAIRQYDNIMATLDGDIGELPITIDAELDHGLPKATITRTVRALADKIIQATHRHPFLYSRGNWIDQFLYVGEFTDLPLWLATYLSKPWWAKYAVEHPGPPILPNGATTYAIHQTGDKMAPICSTTTKAYQDYDRWNGDKASLLKFAGVAEITPPQPTPQPADLRFEVLRDMNVRAGPSTDFADVGDLKTGQILNVINVAGGNSWIEFESGKWAALNYNGIAYLAKR